MFVTIYNLTQKLADEWLSLKGLEVVDVLPSPDEDDGASSGSHTAQEPFRD